MQSLLIEDVLTQVIKYSEEHTNRLQDLVHNLNTQMVSLQDGDGVNDLDTLLVLNEFKTSVEILKKGVVDTR